MVRKSNVTIGHCGDEMHGMEATFSLASDISTGNTGTKATLKLPTAMDNGSNTTTLAMLVSSSSSSSSNSSVAEREAPSPVLADYANVTAAIHDSKKRKSTDPPEDRLLRSRERNKIHARKTRQRKKEQMQVLQSRADELKADQLRLKQIINEKNTASILVGLFACSTTSSAMTTSGEDASCTITTSTTTDEDPRVEELLKRPAEEIPDASKISDLPSLILPGHYSMRRGKAGKLLPEPGGLDDDEMADFTQQQQQQPDDGIDYVLLSKDRSKCSAEELDRIRRERNKLHAKRTRDRKRRFMEEMSEVCRQLQDENNLLRHHLRTMDPHFVDDNDMAVMASEEALPAQPALLSPKAAVPIVPSKIPSQTTTADQVSSLSSSNPSMAPLLRIAALPPRKIVSIHHHGDDQIRALLAAAGSFEQNLCITASSSSSSSSSCTRRGPMVQSPPSLIPSKEAATAPTIWDSDSCSSLIDSDDGSGGRPVPFPKRPRLELGRSPSCAEARC